MEKVSKETVPAPKSPWSEFEKWGGRSWFAPCQEDNYGSARHNEHSESKSYASADGPDKSKD